MSGPGRAGRCGDTEGQGYSGVVWKRLGTWRVCPPVAICAPARAFSPGGQAEQQGGAPAHTRVYPSQFLDISVVPGVVLGT